MALPVATRVPTWDILARGAAETRALISRIGAPDAIVPIDVRLQADTEASAAALAHMLHVAAGNGLRLTHEGKSGTVRGVPLLQADRIDDKVAAWLSAAGVRTLDPDTLRTEFEGASGMRFRAGEETLEAAQIVFADDAAILDLPEDHRPAGLEVEPMTATLLGKTRSLGAKVVLWLDRGVRLQQRADGSVLALVAGESELEPRLASALPGPFPVPRLATGRFRRIITAHGAPTFTRLGTADVRVVAGLGDAAAFFAIALARFVAGASEPEERSWFAAHEALADRHAVAEFVS
jgi:hypothetical protein